MQLLCVVFGILVTTSEFLPGNRYIFSAACREKPKVQQKIIHSHKLHQFQILTFYLGVSCYNPKKLNCENSTPCP